MYEGTETLAEFLATTAGWSEKLRNLLSAASPFHALLCPGQLCTRHEELCHCPIASLLSGGGFAFMADLRQIGGGE